MSINSEKNDSQWNKFMLLIPSTIINIGHFLLDLVNKDTNKKNTKIDKPWYQNLWDSAKGLVSTNKNEDEEIKVTFSNKTKIINSGDSCDSGKCMAKLNFLPVIEKKQTTQPAVENKINIETPEKVIFDLKNILLSDDQTCINLEDKLQAMGDLKDFAKSDVYSDNIHKIATEAIEEINDARMTSVCTQDLNDHKNERKLYIRDSENKV